MALLSVKTNSPLTSLKKGKKDIQLKSAWLFRLKIDYGKFTFGKVIGNCILLMFAPP